MATGAGGLRDGARGDGMKDSGPFALVRAARLLCWGRHQLAQVVIENPILPDFMVKINDSRGPDERLNLMLEVSGEARKDKAAKAATARTLWVPAINNHGGFGRWAYIEISDSWDATNTIRAMLSDMGGT